MNDNLGLDLSAVRQKTIDNSQRIERHEKDIGILYKALTYRLPLWATFLIAGQSGIIGWLIATIT